MFFCQFCEGLDPGDHLLAKRCRTSLPVAFDRIRQSVVDMEDIPPGASFHHALVKPDIINCARITPSQPRSISHFHCMPALVWDAHHTSPGHPPWHPLNESMPEPSGTEVKQPRFTALPNVISCPILVAFAVSQQWTRILFNGRCPPYDLLIDT